MQTAGKLLTIFEIYYTCAIKDFVCNLKILIVNMTGLFYAVFRIPNLIRILSLQTRNFYNMVID
jgi:hypothetical protein